MLKTYKFAVALAGALTLFLTAGGVAAQNITTCNNCSFSQYLAKAKSQGPGLHYIVDETKVQLKLYRVEEDSPGYLLASPVSISPDVSNMFYGIVEARTMGQPSINIDVTPDDTYPNAWFPSNPFGGFENSDASEVVNSVSVRHGLGQNLGIYHGDNGLYARLSRTLSSITQSGLGFFSGAPVNIVYTVTFRDGSKCQFTLSADKPDEAQFVPGSAEDKNGIPLPDASIFTDPSIAANYHGEIAFPDQESVNDWLHHMELLGVPVTTAGGTQNFRYFCQFIGTEFRCWKM